VGGAVTESSFIPAVLFGALLGALVTLSVRNPQDLPASLIPSLVTALTTLVVGWWIHTAVRRRGELDRIAIEYLADLCRRIGDSIPACFVAAGDARTATFRRLGMDIAGLRDMGRRTLWAGRPDLERALLLHYFDFKKQLTGSAEGDDGRALKASGELRMTVLRIQWRLSKHFLDRARDVDVFASN